MRPDDLGWLSAVDLAAAVWTAEVSPVDVARVQIAGRGFADATVLRAAAAFEAACPWSARHPAL